MADLDTDIATIAPGQAAAPALKVEASPLRSFWRSFSKNKGAVAGLAIMMLLALIAIFADVLSPHDPIEQFRDNRLLPPFWVAGGNAAFPLGTDDIGRDLLSRLLVGARLSLVIGLTVVTVALAIGAVLGLTAAFAGGMIDIAIMRFMDLMLVFPSLLLAIVVVSILGPSLIHAMSAVTIVTLPNYVRLARASALSELGREYVTASRLAGAGTLRLMFRTVLPNCAAPLIVAATLGFSNAILDAAALGFLGLGAQPPTPEWGKMLADGREYIERAWWLITLPGLCVLVTVLAFNILGDGLRDALDPKLKR